MFLGTAYRILAIPSIKEINRLMGAPGCLCMLPPFQNLNQMTDFYEIWYERYAITGHPNSVLFNLLKSIITTW
jgi:hypothetical protein